MKKKVTVNHINGIHLTPASQIARFALKHPEVKLRLEKKGQRVEAASVMGILSLELTTGSEVEIYVSNGDKALLAKLERLVSG